MDIALDCVMQNTPYMMVLIGDFDAKCTNLYKHDKTNFEGIAKENIPWQCAFYQVINQPTHILESFSPCIDLIFTFQPNLITELGCTQRYIQIVTMHLHLRVTFGIMKKKILILFDDQLSCFIRTKHLQTVM